MANLHKIKELASAKKIPLTKIASIAGMTPPGLHGAINKDDITFSYLDRIANFLDIDLYVFSDFPRKKDKESSISVGGDNLGNIAGGNLIQVTLPEKGQQKIIKPDGTTIVEPISLKSRNALARKEKAALEEKIKLQQQLIESLQDQLMMYKNKQ